MLPDALDKYEHLFDNEKIKETSKQSDGLTMDMDKADKVYIAIDLKSFYASVECVERGLDPLTTCLLVADASRTDKTICLAVSPGLKAYGIPGRPRLFEAKQVVARVNADRRYNAPHKCLNGKSFYTYELDDNPSLALDFITAPPRMSLYMKYSTDIYKIYLKYIAPEDIHVYSCDEVFIYVTPYLNTYNMSPHDLAITMIRDVLSATGITATVGIGTNMFLCKVAMDIVAKHMPADKDGVRIAELDEASYREKLWPHMPITDIWSIGGGTARRLAGMNLFTMGDVALYSEYCEDALYRAFGIKAELLIDHAWGWEPCTIDHVKNYVPQNSSLSTGQVLTRPYTFSETKVIVREMSDMLTLDLVKKNMVTDQMTLTICYEWLKDPDALSAYKGTVHYDFFGRPTPKHAHGTANLKEKTASTRIITNAVVSLYERITDRTLMIRRVVICACNITSRSLLIQEEYEQLDLFTDYEERERQRQAEKKTAQKETAIQLATLEIKSRYGKNALLKGTNFLKSATARERNRQVGGHRA